MSIVIRTIRSGVFAVAWLTFVTLAQAGSFQATVTTNSQTMGITVTRLPGDNKMADSLPENVKDHALLSLEENLRIGRYLFAADWSLLSVVNDDSIFQVSLNDDSIGRNQEPVPAGNMTHLLWGVTYCRKHNELTQLSHESLNESDALQAFSLLNTTEVQLPPLLDNNMHQQSTCLKKYIIQCPTSGQTAYQMPPNLNHPTNWGNAISSPGHSHGSYFIPDERGDDGAGWNNRPHTFDRSPLVFCPACHQHGCIAQFNIDNSWDTSMAQFPPDDDEFDVPAASFLLQHYQEVEDFAVSAASFFNDHDLREDDISAVMSAPSLGGAIETTQRFDGSEVFKPKKSKIRRKKKSSSGVTVISFMLGLLFSEGNSELVRWINKKNGTFLVVNANELASRWGEKKKRQRSKKMTWANMSRGIRSSYKNGKGPILKSGEKKYIYRVNLEHEKIKQIMMENKYK